MYTFDKYDKIYGQKIPDKNVWKNNKNIQKGYANGWDYFNIISHLDDLFASMFAPSFTE